jgi:transcriptional regulator with XRE-family HTH domain
MAKKKSKSKAKAKIDPQDQVVYEALGRAIQARRKKLDLSHEELAHIAGLNAAYVGGVERGERNVALKNIAKLCKALKISTAELFKAASL